MTCNNQLLRIYIALLHQESCLWDYYSRGFREKERKCFPVALIECISMFKMIKCTISVYIYDGLWHMRSITKITQEMI